jgi:transketolase
MFAGHKQLDTLCAIVDNNNLQIDGCLDDVCSPYPIAEKFRAFNWYTIEVDGHDFDQLEDAFKQARENKGKPTAIIMTTKKGKGVSFMEDKAAWHGTAPNDEQYEVAMKELNDALAALQA